METLNPAAGVIPGVTLAVQSCKATYNFLAPFNGGPDLLTHSKSILAQTEQALMLLNGILLKNQSESGVSKTLNAALRTTGLGSTLQSTHLLCEEFRTTLFKIIRNSTDGQSSKRDKTAMNTRDPDIRRFNEQLGDCQKRISSAVSSISL